ncbi:MAG: YraN family protein [Tissierellia bacterium]|nr:YraN family protein [Tissierellia bacterium]
MKNKSLGARGEALALAHLEREGYQILERNYTCPSGEIDIIAQSPQGLVFVEVKTRVNKKYGLAREAVHRAKRGHIARTALYYMQEKAYFYCNGRFDVIEVYLSGPQEDLVHIENAFDLNDLEG